MAANGCLLNFLDEGDIVTVASRFAYRNVLFNIGEKLRVVEYRDTAFNPLLRGGFRIVLSSDRINGAIEINTSYLTITDLNTLSRALKRLDSLLSMKEEKLRKLRELISNTHDKIDKLNKKEVIDYLLGDTSVKLDKNSKSILNDKLSGIKDMIVSDEVKEIISNLDKHVSDYIR